MTSFEEPKQKRNKPCENCRAHRRRCIPTHSAQCERCTKKNLPCIYKFTVKPTVTKNIVPAFKRMRLVDQVRDIEDTLDALEEEFQLILTRKQPLPPSCLSKYSTDDDYESNHAQSSSLLSSGLNTVGRVPLTTPSSDDKKDHSWTATIRPTDSGVQLQTSIHNIGELIQFLSQTFGCFSVTTPQRTPNYYSNNAQQTMRVTNKLLKAEYTLRQVFGKMPNDSLNRQSNSTTENDILVSTPTLYAYDHTRQAAVLQLVESYFNCVRSMTPIVASYYHPLIQQYPDSSLAYSLASFSALSTCVIHVDEKTLPYGRRNFGLFLYQEAHEKLRDDLFDDQDDRHASIETIIALLTMSQTSMILLRNHDTRLYLHFAWQMVLDLRADCMTILQNYRHHGMHSSTETTPVELARAETWRRLFYGVRYMLISVRIMHSEKVDFTGIMAEGDIGYPQPLACEMKDTRRKRMVEVYSLFSKLDDCHISSNVNAMGYRLFAGELDRASISDILYLEHRLFSFWQDLPSEFRLTQSPIEYLDPSVVWSCPDLHILHLNMMYYCHWLTLETRFMQSPNTADLQGTTLTRLDSGRALLIVSICSDALAHLFQVMHQNEPCMLDLHWLLITTDALSMLTEAANVDVRNRAGHNLQICLPILMTQTQPRHSQSTLYPVSKSFSSSTTTSALSSLSSMSSSSSSSSSSLSLSSSVCPSSSTYLSSKPLPATFPSPSTFFNAACYGNQHLHPLSPGNSSASTSSDSLDEADDEEDWRHAVPSAFYASSDLYPAIAYYGEIKKSVKCYLMDGST